MLNFYSQTLLAEVPNGTTILENFEQPLMKLNMNLPYEQQLHS